MSPLSYEFEDFFAKDGGSLDEEVTTINPDEFLNLDEFKTENESPPLQQSLETPPISPQSSSIIIDNALYQNIRFIPITTLKCSSQQFTPKPTKKIKVLFPKPSSSSDSDTNPNIHQTDMISINPKIPVTPVDRAIIKQQRLIRNRESAIQSRKKKKDYVVTLETENSVLRKENCLLKAENSRLKERINVYSKFTCRCASTISNKLTTARNGTFMLAVIFLVGFNIFPMGNLLNSHYKQPLKEQSHEFHSRNLLFANENISINGNNTETLELSEQSIYLNQTTKILNANIENIRRWIPAPDLNVTYPKTFDFEPDPMQDKLLKMYEETWEQSQKSNKKKRKPKKNPAEPVQLYNPKNNLVKLSEFFEEIQRKDDVFYVFSFRADHLLLPASDNNYNVSQIKMNLLMPRSNGKFLMCSVF